MRLYCLIIFLNYLLNCKCFPYFYYGNDQNKHLRSLDTNIQKKNQRVKYQTNYENLVWSDEFNGDKLSSEWVYDIGGSGWGNHELQYYKKDNIYLQNGNLVIVALKEHFGGKSYTSGRIKTYGKRSWRYGRFEARIKIPVFSGSWPAFWMLGDSISWEGWPSCGEIDIMETINYDNTCYGTVHWSDRNGKYKFSEGSFGPIDMTEYHIYSIEWTPHSIRWFVDNLFYHKIDIRNNYNGTEEFHMNFYLLLNLAIGERRKNGFDIHETSFPAEMLVDYVRVYQ